MIKYSVYTFVSIESVKGRIKIVSRKAFIETEQGPEICTQY